MAYALAAPHGCGAPGNAGGWQPLTFEDYLDDVTPDADIHLVPDQSEGQGNSGNVHLDLIVGGHPGALPATEGRGRLSQGVNRVLKIVHAACRTSPDGRQSDRAHPADGPWRASHWLRQSGRGHCSRAEPARSPFARGISTRGRKKARSASIGRPDRLPTPVRRTRNHCTCSLWPRSGKADLRHARWVAAFEPGHNFSALLPENRSVTEATISRGHSAGRGACQRPGGHVVPGTPVRGPHRPSRSGIGRRDGDAPTSRTNDG